MNQDAQETQLQLWEDFHPWLAQSSEREDEDSVDEVIRYTLDELRLA